jgi:hypothetical protein
MRFFTVFILFALAGNGMIVMKRLENLNGVAKPLESFLEIP